MAQKSTHPDGNNGRSRKDYHAPILMVMGDLWEITKSSTEDVDDLDQGGSGSTT